LELEEVQKESKNNMNKTKAKSKKKLMIRYYQELVEEHQTFAEKNRKLVEKTVVGWQKEF
jgi:hypothetical protein